MYFGYLLLLVQLNVILICRNVSFESNIGTGKKKTVYPSLRGLNIYIETARRIPS